MHYYKKEIGDYHKKAGRLTMLQHGAYNLLIDSCYDREIFPTMEEAIDWLWASSKEEIEAIEFVLGKFFKLIDGVYVQNHIREDIDKYHANAATNKRIAIDREAKKREESTKRVPLVNEQAPNQEPLTKNHKPKEKKIAFEEFYISYPRKTQKTNAQSSWKKLTLTEQEEAIKQLPAHISSEQWQEKKYIPHPATWLNQKRWEDELVIKGNNTAALNGWTEADREAARRQLQS
jgi:uncharacterized protein YdaU (DUF1376 family)